MHSWFVSRIGLADNQGLYLRPSLRHVFVIENCDYKDDRVQNHKTALYIDVPYLYAPSTISDNNLRNFCDSFRCTLLRFSCWSSSKIEKSCGDRICNANDNRFALPPFYQTRLLVLFRGILYKLSDRLVKAVLISTDVANNKNGDRICNVSYNHRSGDCLCKNRLLALYFRISNKFCEAFNNPMDTQILDTLYHGVAL